MWIELTTMPITLTARESPVRAIAEHAARVPIRRRGRSFGTWTTWAADGRLDLVAIRPGHRDRTRRNVHPQVKVCESPRPVLVEHSSCHAGCEFLSPPSRREDRWGAW